MARNRPIIVSILGSDEGLSYVGNSISGSHRCGDRELPH